MARATYKSNGRSQPRNSQPSQTQPSQRNRRATVQDEEEDEEEEEVEAGEGSEMDEDGGMDDAQKELDRKVNALVRLALFNEYKRMPLRKDEINKKVMGGNTRAFNQVLNLAQTKLQMAFGMELVELMSRAEREKAQNDNDETREGENATGLKKKAIIAAAAATEAEVYEDEILGVSDDEDEENRTYGSVISWSSADELSSMGVMYVLLALILVNQGVLSDMDMKKYLKSFRLPPSASVDFSSKSSHRSMPIDAYLAMLVRQGYLDKSRAGLPGAPKATQGKRGRPSAIGDDEGNNFEWKWGSRAQAEIGEEGIGYFIGEFLVDSSTKNTPEDSDGDEEEEGAAGKRKGKQARGKKKRGGVDDKQKMLEAIMKGIKSAAGGSLKKARS